MKRSSRYRKTCYFSYEINAEYSNRTYLRCSRAIYYILHSVGVISAHDFQLNVQKNRKLNGSDLRSILAEAFNCHKTSLLEGFVTPIFHAEYLKSGLQTPLTIAKLDN